MYQDNTMRSFKEYLTESKRVYDFKIKIAGECPDDCASKIKTILDEYKVESCSEGKQTPIQETHFDFPSLNNIEVTSFDVCVAYPTTSTQLQALLAEKLRLSSANVIVRNPLEEAEILINLEHSSTEKKDALLNQQYEKSNNQNIVGEKQKMSLLKDLNKVKHQQQQVKGVNDSLLAKKSPVEKAQKNIDKSGNTSPVGSKQNDIPDPFKGK